MKYISEPPCFENGTRKPLSTHTNLEMETILEYNIHVQDKPKKVIITIKLSAKFTTHVTFITTEHPSTWKEATHKFQTHFVLQQFAFITLMCDQVSNQ